VLEMQGLPEQFDVPVRESVAPYTTDKWHLPRAARALLAPWPR
jgi:hypothetical protein